MIETDFSRIVAVYIGLAIFGMIYNLAIAYCEKRGWLEGFTWLAVAAGVGATVIALAIIDLQFTVIALGAFIFSGMPMILGAVSRYVSRRERSQRSIVDEALGER